MTDRAEPGDPLDLDGIEQALKAATPGPWHWNEKVSLDDDVDDPKYADYRLMGALGETIIDLQIDHHERIWWQGVSKADAELITAAPIWLAALLTALRDARQRVQELEHGPRVTVVRDEPGLHQEHIDPEVAPDLEATIATLRTVRVALAAAAEREGRYKKVLQYVERKIDERTVELDWGTFVRTVKEALS